ncbi:MAG: MerR family transcriptional regulator [Bacteroidetes bacterium]|jgi:DNA-binding transcriptional MerR regulator|nr:MerR family transcriptional regulator [Bacteroidota bacterium]MBT6687100.1 MerR family transcriptional regulator [Bacteroidota bacterium]MBT7144485.1 MerR family transcriptional regulator [Bacteroidota bacterium]MBT7490802.1 MerR family transcriptional regulator [Bacteroidota bacterium]
MPYIEPKVEKIHYSIGEVAEMFDINTSKIRFWEKEFGTLRPKKSGKGNRIFTNKDIEQVRMIYYLLVERGMTLKGAKMKLKDNKEDTEHNFEIVKKLQNVKKLLLQIHDKI